MGCGGRGRLIVIASTLALALPGSAWAFGTTGLLGQSREHEMITRAALACPAGIPSDGSCFEPASLDQLAGSFLTFGAVGAPDIPPPEGTEAHCDDGDYLPPGVYELPVPYPQDRADARRALQECRGYALGRFRQGLDAAAALLDASEAIRGSMVFLTPSCTFLGQTPGRAKCDVFDGFGRSLHTIQDFYAHTNWSDAKVPDDLVSSTAPPGLAKRALAPLMDMRRTGTPPLDPLLISGCFSLYEVIGGIDGCLVGLLRTPRVHHADINKDKGTIDPVTGAASNATTPRGQVDANFENAVWLAVLHTRQAWAEFRFELIRQYEPQLANRMICALTHDDAVEDCQGRKVAIVVDSSGSNTETDPQDLRVSAAKALNNSLTDLFEAGVDGRPDRSAVIDFDDSASVVSPLADPSLALFGSIDSAGGTNIAGGVTAAIGELTKDPNDSTRGRSAIVVFTDGEDSNLDALIDEVLRAGSLGIRVSFGFLAPPSTARHATRGVGAAPFSVARTDRPTADPPAGLVDAILRTGGVYSTIDSASDQQAFVELVTDRGVTDLDDPNGRDDGGPLTAGASATGRISDPGDGDTFSFQASAGRVLRITVTSLEGPELAVSAYDVRRADTLISAPTREGSVTLVGRLRAPTLLEVTVTGQGSGAYSIAVEEIGVDLNGTAGNDRLKCRPVPTYVRAGAGNDRVTCGPGDDMIVGGPGMDRLAGGAGRDIFPIARGDLARGVETIDGGKDSDQVEFSFARPRGTTCTGGRAAVPIGGGSGWLVKNVEVVLFNDKVCR